jgi:uncharacterized repeat protein (TIGR01451 family)
MLGGVVRRARAIGVVRRARAIGVVRRARAIGVVRRARAIGLAFGVAALGVWAPGGADAQSGGTYSGSASTDLVHVHALNIPDTFELAEASVAPSKAEMSSAGVEGGGNAHAFATNVNAQALSEAIDLNLVVEADHRAPGEPGPVQNTLLELPADPLLNAMVARATAHSRWVNGGCVPVGTPISTATSELADANVITNTPLGTALAAIDNAQGDTVFSRSTTELVDVAGQSGKGVKSRALTQLTGITLFKGTPNALTVNVLAPPVIEAIATGKPGGASVKYSEPILQIVDANGEILGQLNAAAANLEIDVSPLVTLRLGHLTSKVAKDGTSAEGRAVLLEVIVLNAEGATEPLAQLSIAGGVASAKAPSGGVDCSGAGGDVDTTDDGNNDACGTGNPLRELHIGPSTLIARAGQTFTYTISVSNRGECRLTNVKVEQTIDGPPGSSVTSTDPEADSVDGLTVTWDDVGPLDPGDVKVLIVTVEVPDDAEDGDEYSSDVTTTADGGGSSFEETASVDGPTVGDGGSGDCDLSQSAVGPSHEKVEPGEIFNFYISLLNSGGAPCPDVNVTLPIDDGLEFVDCTDDCTHDGNVKIDWTIDEISPGGSETLVATLRVPDNASDGTTYEHTVTIRDGGTVTKSADGPTVTGDSVLAPFPSAGAETEVGGIQLPRTGIYVGTLVLAGSALVGGGWWMRRRARAWLPDDLRG